MPRLPDALKVIVTASSRPVAGLMVSVGIAVTKKNTFVSIHGPSSAEGVIEITRDALLLAAERNISLGAMDYGDPEADGAGTLHVTPVDRDGIARALQGYDQFSRFVKFPAEYRGNLVRANEILLGLGQSRLEAQASCVGGDMRIESGFTHA